MVEFNSSLILTPPTSRARHSDPPLRAKARRVWTCARFQLLLEHAGRFHEGQTEENFHRKKGWKKENKISLKKDLLSSFFFFLIVVLHY